MPKKIREMTEKEFRVYVADKKALPENDPLEQKLIADYAERDADDQMDYILYSMKIKYVGLKDLSLDDMKKMLNDDIYGVKDLWDQVRYYLNANEIRQYSMQLALTLFGDYILDEQAKLGKEVNLGLIKGEDVEDAAIIVTDLVNKAMRKEYINAVQISASDADLNMGPAEPVNSKAGKNADKSKQKDDKKKEKKKDKKKIKPAKIDDDDFEDDWEEEEDELFTQTFAYEVVTDPKTGLVKFGGVPQPIGTALTKDIIDTGNLKMLKDFRYPRGKEKVKLNKREKEYLDYKIHTAEELNVIERKALHDMAWNEKDEYRERHTPKLDEKNGFTGFSHLKLYETQTSNHGCWSCAYSLLFKSRGIDLSQEMIRGFRPDYNKNTPQDEKASKEVGIRMNSDVVNNIFENGDLLHKVLPNTSMNQLTINAMEDVPVSLKTDKGSVQLNDEQNRVFKDYYIKHTTEQLQKAILDALTKDNSPVAINWNNHYVTITGIKEDGTIRVEDSARSRKGQTTRTLSLKEVVEESIYGRDTKDGYVKATGLSLVWIKDIKPVEYSKRTEKAPDLYPAGKEYVKVDAEGNIKVDVPTAVTKFSCIGKSQDGQVNGTGISESLQLDQTELEKLLGGKVENFGPGQFFTGQLDTYFPKKFRYLSDPSLNRYAFYQLEDNTVSLHRLMQASLNNLQRAGLAPDDGGFEKYIDAVKKLALEGVASSNEAEKAQVFKQGVEILEKIGDYFRKKAPDGRTYYQLLEGGLDSTEKREHFRTLWLNLDRMLNLNINVKELQSETEAMWRFNNGLEALDSMPTKYNAMRIYSLWEDLGKYTDGHSKEVYQNDLAEILARELLYEEEVEKMQLQAAKDKDKAEKSQPGDNTDKDKTEKSKPEENMQPVDVEIYPEPLIEHDAVKAEAKKIIQSKAFQVLMSKGHYKTLAKSGDTVRLVNEYMDVKRKLGVMAQDNLDEYTFKDEEYKNKRARIEYIWTELSRMGTGSYDSLGIFKRRENSIEYGRALKVLEDIKDDSRNKKQTDGAYNYMAVEEIKNYLEGKEEVRGSAMGKKRWRLFMTALSEIMPRKEFEEYCDHVNRVRGVENKPDSKDYVGPELFYKKNVELGTVLVDTTNRILSGKATKRDYARLLALRSKGIYTDNGQEKFGYDRRDITRTTIRKETDKILKDTDFAAFMELVDADTLKNMMKESQYGARLADYKTYLEGKQTELEKVLNVYENAHPLSTQFIMDHVMVKTGAAIRALWEYSNADEIRERDYETIHKYMAQHVLQSIMETEADEPEEAKRPMTNKLTGRKDLIEPSVSQIMESEEFKEALKTMKLDKPDPAKIKAFLLGQKGDTLAVEFNKQLQNTKNRKKEVTADKKAVNKINVKTGLNV